MHSGFTFFDRLIVVCLRDLSFCHFGFKCCNLAIFEREAHYDLAESERIRVGHHIECLKRVVVLVFISLMYDHISVAIQNLDIKSCREQRNGGLRHLVYEVDIFCGSLERAQRFCFYHRIFNY